MSLRLLAVPALVFLLAAPAVAGDAVVIQPPAGQKATEQRTLPLASGARLKVVNVNGRIQVSAWDREEVSFTGTFTPSSRDEQVKVTLQPTAAGMDIRGEVPKPVKGQRDYRGAVCQMELKVPRRLLPSLETVNGEIELADVQGQARLQTVNGKVVARNLSEGLEAETVNGGIQVQSVKGGLKLQTVNGGIEALDLDGQGQGIEAGSVNGGIRLKLGQAKGHLSASTVHGGVTLNLPGATDVQIKRTSASARIPGGDQRIELSTVNGGITVE